MMNARQNIVGVVLAGGQSRRFGSLKAFATLGRTTLISHVIARAAPQVSRLLLSADGDPRFAALGLPLVMDEVKEDDGTGAGPLAGVLASLDWCAAHEPAARWLASFAVDTPLLPEDMIERLRTAAEEQGAEIACSRSAGRLHPLQALWSTGLRVSLGAAVANGERAVHRFVTQRRLVIVDFAVEPFDPFANVNTPADLARLESALDH